MCNSRKWVMLMIAVAVVVGTVLKAGDYLIVNQTPTKADAIVVFSGDRGSRMEKAAELYHCRYAQTVLYRAATYTKIS